MYKESGKGNSNDDGNDKGNGKENSNKDKKLMMADSSSPKITGDSVLSGCGKLSGS